MELTKEIIERIYSLIEKSKTDGKIRKGVNEVTKSLERGEAKLSVSAEDISPAEITSHLPTIAKEKGIVHVTVPSKTELGAAAGLPVATASVAVVSGDSKLIDALLVAPPLSLRNQMSVFSNRPDSFREATSFPIARSIAQIMAA